MDSRRAEAFSDGVFAVAITVLVFNLLGIGSRDLTAHPYHVLLAAWPNYLAYAVSFLTIGIMWINHHAMFAAITMVDRRLLIINLILLMGVVAIPFPTALVAEQLAARAAATGRADIAVASGGRAGGGGGLRRGHGRDLDRLLGRCGSTSPAIRGGWAPRGSWSGRGWRTFSSARACSATSRPR